MVALKLIFVGLLTSAVWMSILWAISQKIKNAAVVDVGWGISVLSYTIVYFFLTKGLQGKEFLALVTVILWSGRLSYHLYLDRIQSGREEDGRYKKLREHFKTDVPKKMFLFFQAQGLFNAVLSVPFLIIALSPVNTVGLFELLAFTISYLAIFGETVADYQLKQFKKNPLNKGKVCEVGLWKFSRHPNYFFEFLIWVGFFFLGLKESHGLLGIVAPAAILYTLLKFTGIPATEEQALRSKGDLYRSYQKRVSAFVPLPPKK
jgi:steroid 5-alpha reductase family enzyme